MAYYQQNMLSIKSRAILANILAEVVVLSDSIETFRQNLARIDFFDCIALFRYLDREEKGYLREKDFQRAIGTSHRKLLTYAFSWFDTMKVGEISRLQFAAFLLPKDNLELRQLVAKRVQNPHSDSIQQETILLQYSIFSKLLVQIMNRQLKIIELRRQLIKSQDYSIRGVLQAMDVHGHQWVSGEDIVNFLKNYGFDVGLRQIEKLVEAINCSFDGKITEEQLKWTIEGFENKNKTYLHKIKDSNKKEIVRPSSSKKDQEEITVPMTQQFTLMEDTISDITEKYRQLTESLRVSEEEEQKLDELLRLQEKEVTQSIDRECARFLAQFRQKKLTEVKQRQLLLERQEELRRLEEQRIIRSRVEQEIAARALESRRRQRELQLMNQLRLRTAYVKNNANDEVENVFKRSPPRPNQLLSYSPLRRDYTNLTNLSRLTQVQSYRKPSERSTYRPYLEDSNTYLNEANHLKSIIKRQREIEKQIQNKFTSGRYDASKYSSRGSSKHKFQQVQPKHYKTGFDNTFSRQKEQKEEPSPTKAFQSTQANRFISTASRRQGS